MGMLYILAGAALTIMVVVLFTLFLRPTTLPTPVVSDADLTNTTVALGLLVETANAATMTSAVTLTPPTVEAVVTQEAIATEEVTEASEPTATDTPFTPTVTPSATITETPRVSPTPEISPTVTQERGATLTPTSLPTSVGIVEGQNPLTLRYNDQFIALLNQGDKTIAIEQLSMRSLSGVAEDTFSNTGRSLGITLKPGECVVLRSGRAVGNIPAQWNCQIPLESTLNKNALFWRADAGTPSEDTQFVVEAAGEVVGTCDTAGRAVGRIDTIMCDVLWPLQASNPDPTAQG
jgi:hypothetical protein